MSTKDDIDIGGAFKDLPLVLLRKASPDCDLKVWITLLLRRKETQLSVETIVRILADGTGIEDNEIGIFAVKGRQIASAVKGACDALGIMRIHLTPKGLDHITALHRAVILQVDFGLALTAQFTHHCQDRGG